MRFNALLMDDNDNVVTCVEEVSAGQEVIYYRGDQICKIQVKEMVPYCHKIALKTFEEGDEVVKYGELIGKTLQKIEEGCWVSDKNIFSVPRDYSSEYIK